MRKIEQAKDFMDKAMGQYYDIEYFTRRHEISHRPQDIKDSRIAKFKHLKFVNINGLGIGQVHFLDDNGQYVLLPWCYILSMFPSQK